MLYIILANSMADILPFMFLSVRLRPGFVHSMLFALRRRVADPKALGGARGAHRDSTVSVDVLFRARIVRKDVLSSLVCGSLLSRSLRFLRFFSLRPSSCDVCSAQTGMFITILNVNDNDWHSRDRLTVALSRLL